MSNFLNWRKALPITFKSSQNPFLAMQQALDNTMREFYRALDISSVPSEHFENLTIAPSVDVVDDKDAFKVEAEMPGMGEEDIKVNISEGVLTIQGEKETSKQDKDKNYMMREINYGSYLRSIPLPEDADTEKAKASFKKGMLWVVIPKKPGATKPTREIKVEAASN